MNLRPVAVLGGAVLLCAGLAACGGDAEPAAEERILTVYAASSLRVVFEELGEEFESTRPGLEVRFNFAGSSDLAAQIRQGAPADVFASADERSMEMAGPMAEGWRPFATNTLAIAVPTDNPAGIDGLEDLTSEGVQLVTCSPEVPCGAAAATVERNAGLDWKPVSEEPSVADVLGKVASGEADAGLVYVTDVAAAGDRVASIEIPARVNATNSYPIVTLGGSEFQVDLAAEWVDLVLGAEGRARLGAAGFGTP